MGQIPLIRLFSATRFANTITWLIGNGERWVLLDLSTVTYVDSTTIGCAVPSGAVAWPVA